MTDDFIAADRAIDRATGGCQEDISKMLRETMTQTIMEEISRTRAEERALAAQALKAAHAMQEQAVYEVAENANRLNNELNAAHAMQEQAVAAERERSERLLQDALQWKGLYLESAKQSDKYQSILARLNNPDEALVDSALVAFGSYEVQGTPDHDDNYGPPFRLNGPWLLVDVSRAEPEVNWPGELIGSSSGQNGFADANRERWRLIIAALARTLTDDQESNNG